jgi:hypothetical protein
MCAVPNMAVFCSSLTPWCPGMLLTCFMNDLEIVLLLLLLTLLFCYYYYYYFVVISLLLFCYIIIIIIIIIIINVVSCHRPFLPGTSLVPAVIPTAQASSFTLQYFLYYV